MWNFVFGIMVVFGAVYKGYLTKDTIDQTVVKAKEVFVEGVEKIKASLVKNEGKK